MRRHNAAALQQSLQGHNLDMDVQNLIARMASIGHTMSAAERAVGRVRSSRMPE